MFKKVISLALSLIFSLQTCGFAQVGQLNLAGYLGQGGGAPVLDRFRPASLRYFSYEPDSDNFQILLDKADEKDLSDVQVKDKADELMRYFRIGLSLPNDKFWVNLRPDAPEQIIDPALEQTDMGKIMLEADLQLKKDTSSLTSPQTKEGKEYWDKLYKKAGELFGSENITIPTITRPWIVPGEIIVRQSGNSGSPSLPTSAYIYKAALKVMLEEDHLRGMKDERRGTTIDYSFNDPRLKELNEYSTQLIRELIIPQLTKEVNRAKRYAGLRQVYYSLILARWFKGKFQGLSPKGTVPDLIDSGNLNNLTSQEPWSKDTYYQGYKKSFEQGEYNLSETVHTPTGQVIRRYVSGGISAGSALKVSNHFDVERMPWAGPHGVFFNYTSSGSKPGVRAAASALTLEEAKKGIVDIIKDSVETNVKYRIRTSNNFEQLYDEIVYILEEGIITIETVMKRLVAAKRTLKKGIITDELMRLGIDKAKIEFSCDSNEPKKIPYTDGIGYSYDFPLRYKSNDKTVSVSQVNIISGVNGIYYVNLYDHMNIIVEGEKITVKYASQTLLDLGIKDLKGFAAEICKALGINGASSALTERKLTKEQIDLLETLLPSDEKLSEEAISAINNFMAYPALYPYYLEELRHQVFRIVSIDNKGRRHIIVKQKPADAYPDLEISRDLLISAFLFKEYSDVTWDKERMLGVKKVLHYFYDFVEYEKAARKDIPLNAEIEGDLKNIINLEKGNGGQGFGIDSMTDMADADIVKAHPILRKIDPLASGDMDDLFIEYSKEGLLDYYVSELESMYIEKDKNKLYAALIAFQKAYQEVVYLEEREQRISRNDWIRIYDETKELTPFIANYLIGITTEKKAMEGICRKGVYVHNLTDRGGYIYIEKDEAEEMLNLAKKEYEENSKRQIASSGIVSQDRLGAVDFRAMDMLIQPAGSFKGLDFRPVALSSSALEAMDLERDLEGINQMTLGRRRTHPQRLKEYISACIFKGKIDEKADDFILSMLEVFQLQAEEGIESASQDREAVVLADTRGYVLPEKRLAASNSYSLN